MKQLIDIRLHGSLLKYRPDRHDAYPIRPGLTIGAVLDELGVPPLEAHLLFINDTRSAIDTVLSDGDSLRVFPLLGGG